MRHSKHIWRMGLLVFLAIVGFVFARMLLIPESFGRYGAYRAANVEEQMALVPQHGEVDGCNQCHTERVAFLRTGAHKNVACENCHAPMATHVNADLEKVGVMHANKTGDWCIRCHLKIPGRPATQPQIDPPTHLAEVGMPQEGRDWSDQVCFKCHNPHSPGF